MSIEQDVEELKHKADDLQSTSIAFQILDEFKKTNKRMFCIILVILAMWLLTIGYLVYTLNDIDTIQETNETTQEIEGVEKIENSNIVNGDQYGESKTKEQEYQES